MAIMLDHTIVPAHDKVASAKFFAELFGLSYDGPMGPFAPVRINDSLSLDFDDRWGDNFGLHHYAFHVSDVEFDAIFGRVKAKGLKYGSGPYSREDMQVRENKGARTVYFPDLNGHILEIRTKPSVVEMQEMMRN